jgi:hypothetical protein
VVANAVQKILSLLNHELEESNRQELVKLIDTQAISASKSDTVKQPTSSLLDGINPSIVMTPDSHSYRHTVLPFSKMWGYARLHGLAVWVGRRTGERY